MLKILKNKVLTGAFITALAVFAFVATSNKTEAATCTASVSGNWTTGATWGGTCNTGKYPVAGDKVIINTAITVTVNTAVAAATITVNDPVNASNGITVASPG